MAITYFPAIIERAKEGFSVFFPDLPGCTSGGDTINDAARNAEDALRGHLALMVSDGDEIPFTSDLDQIERDPEVDEAARVLVRADLPGKFIRLNISMDEGLVASIDAMAEKIGLTRSGLLTKAARDFMAKNTPLALEKTARDKLEEAIKHMADITEIASRQLKIKGDDFGEILESIHKEMPGSTSSMRMKKHDRRVEVLKKKQITHTKPHKKISA